MKRILVLAGPWATIGSAVAALVGLGMGLSVPRWVMFGWPVVVILWALLLFTEQASNRLNRKTIEWQAQVIQDQGQFIGEILTKDIDGRE